MLSKNGHASCVQSQSPSQKELSRGLLCSSSFQTLRSHFFFFFLHVFSHLPHLKKEVIMKSSHRLYSQFTNLSGFTLTER